MVTRDEIKGKVLYTTPVEQVHLYELLTKYPSIVSVNEEIWGQLGAPDLDEEKSRQEQERVEREVLEEGDYSSLKCDMRFEEGVT